MANKLKCNICRKVFYGSKNKMYCGRDCKNTAKRKRRNKKNIEESRKESNKRYYLKYKYPLTKKYKKEQEVNKKEQENKKVIAKEYSKVWTINNKEKTSEYRRKSKEKNRQWFDIYKKTLKCEICDYNKCVGSLDFHHKNSENKEFHIGRGLGLRYSKKRILKEIEKCVVLCSNCHRELHFNEKQEKARIQKEAYLKIIEEPKNIYYSIVEKELEKDWFKELQDKAKYNLNRFGGNQYIKVDNGIREKIDIKKILAKKIDIGEKSICRMLQICRRGSEEQKERARTGESSITKIWKELEPKRFTNENN